jgi:cobalt-zinc-cadmium efflux system outer membrane protein
MPPTKLEGRVDMPLPVFHYDQVLARMLANHTDVLTARNNLLRARYNLRAAQVTAIPDIEVRLAVQKDFTTPPFDITHNLQIGGPIPIWDINKGGIKQAQGQLLRAVEEDHRVRDDLSQRLADAFERYQDNRMLLEYYQQRILPDQVRVYKAVYERHNQKPDEVTFGDIINAQQTLAAAVATYISTLALQWQAVVDVAHLIQTYDLFQMGPETLEKQCLSPVADLEQLLALPCCHPSSPLPDPRLKTGDPAWPAVFTDRLSRVQETLPKPKEQNQQAPDRSKEQPANKQEESAVRYPGRNMVDGAEVLAVEAVMTPEQPAKEPSNPYQP